MSHAQLHCQPGLQLVAYRQLHWHVSTSVIGTTKKLKITAIRRQSHVVAGCEIGVLGAA